MYERNLSFLDRVIAAFDDGMRAVFAPTPPSHRPYPAGADTVSVLTPAERRLSESLMRVNHTGEICAQALYAAQALTARDPEVQVRMQQAADEENDHLNWCEVRLEELNGRVSHLNPLWYLGSFAIGTAAGLVGDKWNLGFVVETENQVVAHLADHLQRLSPADSRTRAVLAQMQADEERHARMAWDAGAAELPAPVKSLMRLHSKVMTTVAYWV